MTIENPNQQRAVTTATTTESADHDISAIADTFRANPDLLQQHPELLELIRLPDSRGTASLLEKQVEALKARLKSFQQQHHELLQLARENEHISDSFSAILRQLIGFDNLSEFATELPSSLRATFEIDEVSFKTTQAVARRPDEQQAYNESLRRLSNNKAVCDNRWPSSIMGLFFSDQVESAALVPMLDRTDQVVGILALGAKDRERYTHELGTDHLNRLGHMAGICLARLLPAE